MAKAKRRKAPTEQELAGKTFTVQVTREDIQKGQPKSAFLCPIARAIKRATGVRDVEVDDCRIKVDGLEEMFDLPREIVEFIEAFDENNDSATGRSIPRLKRVKPFGFLLHLPVPVVEGEEGSIEIL